MNRQAVRIANEVAAEGGALVAGNICNTWSYDPGRPERVGRGRPRAVRGAARLGGRGGRRLRDRRDQRLRRRGADRARGLPGARPAGDGHLRQRAAVDDLRRLRLRRGVPTARRRRRGGRRPELLARPGDDAAAARGDPRGGRHPGRGPAGALPDHAGDARPSRRSRPTAGTCSRIQLEPFQCTRFEMADFARQAATSASTTSASAAAARRTTCARWPRPSAARRPPAATRPTSRSIPCSGSRASRARSWAAGAPGRPSLRRWLS